MISIFILWRVTPLTTSWHQMLGCTDHFWSPIVLRYTTEDTVRIVDSFYLQSHTHNYNHSQLFLTLCHIYTAYNLTRRYSILSCHSLHNTLQIKPSHFKTLAKNLLCEFTYSDCYVTTAFLDILVPLIKPSIGQASLQQRARWELCCVTRENVKVTWYSPTPVAVRHHRSMLRRNRIPILLRDITASAHKSCLQAGA
jgi:hypothetical protein